MTINHHERNIRLHCITIGNAPVILGLPWLKLHNRQSTGRAPVSFHSDKCAGQCLTASPQATAIAEERATGNTTGNAGPERPEDDPWNLNTVMTKSRRRRKKCQESQRTSYPKRLHEFLGVFASKSPQSHRHIEPGPRIPFAARYNTPYEPLSPLSEDKMRALKDTSTPMKSVVDSCVNLASSAPITSSKEGRKLAALRPTIGG